MRKHRIATTVGAVALATLLLAVTASAAINARLDGSYHVRGEITGTDGSPPVGTELERTYRFKALCPSGPCQQVKLFREGSNGTISKSVLDLVEPGIYEGTEVQSNPVCANGDPADSRVGQIHVEITRKDHGKALKWKGDLRFDTEGCSENTFQEASLKGRLKR